MSARWQALLTRGARQQIHARRLLIEWPTVLSSSSNTGWAHLQESRIWGEPLYFLAQGAHVGPAALYFLALAGLPTARERLIP